MSRHPQMIEVSRRYRLTVGIFEPTDPQSEGGAGARVRVTKADLLSIDHDVREEHAGRGALYPWPVRAARRARVGPRRGPTVGGRHADGAAGHGRPLAGAALRLTSQPSTRSAAGGSPALRWASWRSARGQRATPPFMLAPVGRAAPIMAIIGGMAGGRPVTPAGPRSPPVSSAVRTYVARRSGVCHRWCVRRVRSEAPRFAVERVRPVA
jgi:hypothetical protein